jgi:hypothetical protein
LPARRLLLLRLPPCRFGAHGFVTLRVPTLCLLLFRRQSRGLPTFSLDSRGLDARCFLTGDFELSGLDPRRLQ